MHINKRIIITLTSYMWSILFPGFVVQGSLETSQSVSCVVNESPMATGVVLSNSTRLCVDM